jgi:TrkA domain protein
MEPTAHRRKTALPGVGTRYDLETEAGRHLSVVVRQDGWRILALHDPEDDDNCRDSAALEPHESTALAKLLTPDPVAHLHQHMEIDLVTEYIPITKRSPYAGRALGSPRPHTHRRLHRRRSAPPPRPPAHSPHCWYGTGRIP